MQQVIHTQVYESLRHTGSSWEYTYMPGWKFIDWLVACILRDSCTGNTTELYTDSHYAD